MNIPQGIDQGWLSNVGDTNNHQIVGVRRWLHYQTEEH